MPDEVTLDVTTIEENVTVETTAGDVVEIQVVAPTGPTGATGPAGPNSVTSATTSDGTANLTLNNVSTASFTAGNSSTTSGEITIFTNGPVFQWRSDTVEYGERGFTFLTTDITSEVNYTLPNASGTLAITGNTNGESDKLTSGTISGATTFNATSYTYGTGAAAAHRTALGLTTLATTTPGTNVANFLATPTSDNLASALTDENGTGGGFVRAEGATLTTPTFTGSAARANGQNAVPATSDEVMTRGQSDSRIGKVAVMSADVTVVSSTTPVPLTASSSNHPDGLSELGFTLAANKTYAFEFIGEFYEATSPKNQLFTLAGPSGSSFSSRIIAGSRGSTAVYQFGGESTVPNLIITGSTNGVIKIYGLIKMGGTSGNVTLRFSQNSSTANPTTILKGSTMILFGGA